jgi:excisionase family DNA binding protein
VEQPPELVESLADAIAERLELPRASRWLDVPRAADHLAKSEDAVRKAAQRRQLPMHQPYGAGSRYLFDRDELDAWVRQNGRRG